MIPYFVTALAPVLWGTTYVVTTLFLPEHRPLLAATVRALPVGLAFLAMGRWVPDRTWLFRGSVLGLLNFGVFFALLFVAAYRLPGGIAATLGGVGPLVVTLASWPLLGRKPRLLELGAAVAGAAGVAWLVLGPDARWDGLGVLAALGGTASMALGTILTRRWGPPPAPVGLAGLQMAVGGAALLVVCLGFEGLPSPLTVAQVGGYAYLSVVGCGLAYLVWFWGIGQLGVGVSFLGLLSPVVAVACGAVFLGQGVTGSQGWAMAVVFGAIVVGQLPGRGSGSDRPKN